MFSVPYVVTGVAANLRTTRRVTADVGAYTYTGVDAGLFTSRRMAADVGAYALSGQDASLVAARFMTGDVGAYIYDGQDIAFQRGVYFGLDGATYDLTGYDATIVHDYPFPAASGVYQTAGVSANMFFSQYFTGDMEFMYADQELRTMTVPEPADRNITYKSTMAVEPEEQIMYVPSKDYTAEDPVHPGLELEPRQRALV